ncbi:MAG: response regulator [Bacteroidetes bacterium]|nr:response regulator [Bacteroidota bacterium]
MKNEHGYLSPSLIDTKGKQMPDHQNILIFLVDDNELYLRALEQKFKMNPDLTIKTFLSGEDCVKNITLKPDIIVLDYFMDGNQTGAMDGFKTLIKIKEVSPGSNVIMLSSQESTEVAVNCIKFGAFDYIVKNDKVFCRLKQTIKKIFSIVSVEKELIVWDW